MPVTEPEDEKRGRRLRDDGRMRKAVPAFCHTIPFISIAAISDIMDRVGICGAGPPLDVNIREVDFDNIAEAKHIMGIMLHYRKLCDDKASILLAIFGAIVVAVIMMGSGGIAELFSSLSERQGLWPLATRSMLIVSAMAIAIGLALLIRAVDPNTTTSLEPERKWRMFWKKEGTVKKTEKAREGGGAEEEEKVQGEGTEKTEDKKKNEKNKSESLLYYRGIIKNGYDAFKKKYNSYGKTEYLKEILEETFILAYVCERKYTCLKWGLRLSAIGIGSFALFALIGFVFF